MSRLLPLFLMSLTLGVPAAHAQEAPPAKSPTFLPKLEASIKVALKQKGLAKSKVAVHVVDLKDGAVLYAHNADTPMNPASNMKLVTSAAVLDAFGPSRTFTTRVIAQKVTGSKVTGQLTLQGGGDPSLGWQHMLAWAHAIKLRGITQVDADIVVDAGLFDAQDLPPAYEQKQQDGSYRAPVGALTVAYNATGVVVSPGEAGKPARVRLSPDNDYVQVENTTETVAGRGSSIRVKAVSEQGRTVIKVSGRVGQQAATRTWRKRIDDPALHAGHVFAKALKAVGIAHKGKVRRGELAKGEVLVAHASSDTARLVGLMNKWSNNVIAEQLFKLLGSTSGAAATFDAARKRVEGFLTRSKISPKGLTIYNGSGLFDGNLISAAQLTALLRVMHTHKNAPEYKASLAIGGVDGTLGKRFKSPQTRGNLRAKTGTLNEVSALSGYVKTAGGRDVAFSIMLNDTPTYASRLRGEQDKIAQIIAESKE